MTSNIRPRRASTALAIVAVLSGASPPLSAQSAPEPVSFGIDHFDLDSGLPGMYLPDLAISEDGRLWMLASGLLTSFDGLVFEDHVVEGASNWRQGSPVGIGAGRADTVWVTVGGRLVSYVEGRTRLLASQEKILRDVWQERDGSIWAWDDDGVLRLEDDGFERVIRLEEGWNWGRLPVDLTRLRIQDPDGGTLRPIAADWVLAPVPVLDAWPLPGRADRVLLTRDVGPAFEVTLLDGELVASFPRLPDRRPMLLDRRDLLWTAGPGRVEAFGRAGTRLASLPLDPGARVTSAVEDPEGNVWLGTATHGLYRIGVRPVRVLAEAEGLTDGQVSRVSQGSAGSVLVVDNAGFATRVGPGSVDTLFVPSLEAGQAKAALADRRGTVWLSVLRGDGGWLVGRRVDGSEIRLHSDAFNPHRIVMDPSDDGLLWLVGGDARRFRPYGREGPVLGERLLPEGWGARDLMVARDGATWVAGPRGVARISHDRVQEFRAEDGHPTSDARALHQSEDGAIWIGRYFGGIVRYKGGEFRVAKAADGLWDDVVSALLEDGSGNLWMSSNRGVHRAARRELDDFMDGLIEHVRGHGYGPSAGFRNPEASGWHGHRDRDGALWFPTFSGVAVLDPATVLSREQAEPAIRIRSVTAGGERLVADSALTLARGRRRFDVAYAATLLSGHDGLRYEVMLEDVDADWIDMGDQRQVSYANVPPGRHVFRARAVSGAGVPSRSTAAVALSVPPYPYETRPFALLLVMVAVGSLWLLYGLRVRALKAREVRLRRLVDERTHDLARAHRDTKAALATVETQAGELRSLDEAKSRFFANVSHELRTPLTLVQGPLQDVLDGRLGPTSDAIREQVETVLASGRRLGQLVEQLLDVARLEAGEFRLNVREEDLRPLLWRLARSFGALARNRSIVFEASLPPGPLPALVDADQMEKVYGNLLANALKFTPAGGRVVFDVDATGSPGASELVVTITDDGPGIPEAGRSRIFERFRQVDDSSRRVHGGAGLGLALVKEITELHSGRVDVWSEPGRGSRFTVRVPAARTLSDTPGGGRPQAAHPAATAPTARSPELDTAPAALPLGLTEASDRQGPHEPADAQRPTVLVVEDHAELRAYLRRHLGEAYRVVEARNGVEGLAEARRIVPDLVLCDIMMPEMDGDDLCRAIRDDPELSFLPVIMVTARASRQSRLSALEGGADDYLVKPFDPEELRLRVGNLLEARRRLVERLLERGETLPFVPLELPGDVVDRDFTTRLDGVLRERMADEDLDVEAVAKSLYMSRATLYRKTEDALGMPPMEVVWRYRLRQAAHWLRETEATVSEVAYACGFKTVPHFTRRFRDRFGTTPAAYRDG